MSIEDILSRLEKVKRTGRNNWLACCPAHEDRSPSMTLHASDTGKIVVRCFAGCSFEEIVGAVGLGWEPWFPPKQECDFAPAIRRPFPAADVLEAVSSEAFYVAYMAATMAHGYQLEPRDKALLEQSYDRIMEARRLAIG